MSFKKLTPFLLFFQFILIGNFIARDVIYIQNSSFELKTPRCCFVPGGWINCGPITETPPDIHGENMGLFDVNKTPTHGNCFLGLVTRSNETWECIGQELSVELKKGKRYAFQIDLCVSEHLFSFDRKTEQEANFNSPTILRIQGSNLKKGTSEILATSSIVRNTNWKTFQYILEPNDNYDLLILEAFYGGDIKGNLTNGHILLDNCSNIVEYLETDKNFNFITAQKNAIQPYKYNNRFWQYNEVPVFLIAGSENENLFQLSNMEEHLDELKKTGVNLIRNAMSSENEENIQPFQKINGKYDLNKWNEEYWQHFENMLKWTEERNIFLDIELWTFQHFRGGWEKFSPWNPKYNSNYTEHNTQIMSANYDNWWENAFFQTVPKLQNDTIVLQYQKAFIDKLLSYSLQFNNILYSINNVSFTRGHSEWGGYWAEYIKNKARIDGKKVQVAGMYQNSNQQKSSFSHSKFFDFINISRNSKQLKEKHWDQLQSIQNSIKDNPRPLNCNKMFKEDLIDGNLSVDHFWKYIIGGAASACFPDLNKVENVPHQIRSARLLFKQVDIINCQPDSNHELLLNREEDEAYLTCIPDDSYVIYFPEGGQIELDLSDIKGKFTLHWLDIENVKWQLADRVKGKKTVPITTPQQGKSWIALLQKE
ncbi:MAG: hypothetical protein GY705_31735 [Bacteroidetes bacterium]|nr:hypothetical protein [Bacteroidota bacterium]